jgi:hypothetical protein
MRQQQLKLPGHFPECIISFTLGQRFHVCEKVHVVNMPSGCFRNSLDTDDKEIRVKAAARVPGAELLTQCGPAARVGRAPCYNDGCCVGRCS